MSVICFFFAFFLISYRGLIPHQPFDYPTANLSTSWVNDESAPHSISFTDGSKIRSILLRGTSGPKFACGFFCNGTCNSYLFAIFIVQTNSTSYIVAPGIGFPQVVWSANRDYPVRYGAVLNLTITGELVLQDVDGSIAWTTNTTGKSVAGMNLTDDGNLVLFDLHNSVVWQSFDHPTDCLVPGQKLFQGQKLVASVSSNNWTQGLYSLQVTNKGLFAYVESNPPQVYDSFEVGEINTSRNISYVRFLNGSLSLFIVSFEPSVPQSWNSTTQASSAQYMKLMSDGHLRVFEWQQSSTVVKDLLTGLLGECSYPLACGKNAICSGNQQCSCPVSSSHRVEYFRAVNDRQPNLGCFEIAPLTCNATQDQVFLAFENIISPTFTTDMEMVNIETCKQACSNNC